MIPPVPVLRYYSISDDPGGATAPYAVSRRQFGAQLDALVRLDFTTLTVGELLLARASGLPLPERTAVITFDDGFADFAANAWPELAQRELTATLYVTPGHLGGTSSWLESHGSGELPMLTARQLVALAAEGCEIGAHSMTHPQLDSLPRSAAAREVLHSKRVLEHLLGRPIDGFAYPFGRYDAAVRQLVIDAGFRSAAAARNSLSPAGDDWFALARIPVTADFDLERLTDLIPAPSATADLSGKRPRHQRWRGTSRFQHRWLTDRKVGA